LPTESKRPAIPAVLILLLLLFAGLAAAQTSPSGAPGGATETSDGADTLAPSVTPGLLESKLKEAEADPTLDEATKTRLADHYRKSLSNLEAAASYDAKAAAYAKSLETTPATVEGIRADVKELQKTEGQEPERAPEDLSIPELEQRLTKEQADIAAVEAKLSEMEKELESWPRRPAEARERITEAKTALEELEAQLAAPAPQGEPAVLTQARQWALETHKRELRAEILMLDQELLSHAVRGDLLRAYRDKAALDLKILQARKRALEEQLNQRRRTQAEQARAQAEAATREAAGKHPLLQTLAEDNAALTESLAAVTSELDEIDDKQAALESQAKRIAEEFRSARQRLEISGLTQALGQALLDRRSQLPDQGSYRRAAKARERAIAEANLRQIRYNEERMELRDLDAYVDRLLADAPRERIDPELRGEVVGLLEKRKELLDQVQTAEDAYLRALGELDYASNQLLLTVEAYDDFLAERLLWVRSTAPMGLSTIGNLPQAVAWILSPANWLEVAQVLVYEARSSPLFWILILAALTLLWKTRAMRRAILASAEPLRRVRTDSFLYTLKAIGLTALLAAAWPLLFATLGWQLTRSVEATAFTKAVGIAAVSVSTGLFSMRAFYLLCKPGGVADRHFRWSERVLAVIRRNFAWAILVLIPAGFVATLPHYYRDLTYSGSLGRIALIVVMVGLAIFTARLIHPKRGVLQNVIAQHPDGWLNRLRRIWYPVIVAVPLALAGLTLAGYTYTAGTLLRSLVSELWLVLGLVFLHQSIVRWLIVTRRHLAFQAALERRAARIAEEQQTETPAATSPLQVEEPSVDLASLDEQTRRLINAGVFVSAAFGLWAIWSGVLPAFGIFEKVTLWTYTGMIDGDETVVPVTLASIGLVLVIAALAIVAARNLPALLEIALLQRTSISSGSRYAVKTITGYVITAAAVLTIFGTLGLSWGQVQWLIAALGVGIGFGLQEIVANFISGIIILFERPVRVGDIVTIDGTTGVVTKIQIRATTIRNWDKQELLVPNKEFITGRLLNWSLSDNMNRIVINVGIDYGADVRRALELLEEAVKEEERVLEDPAPLFTFEGFGDNALNLVLRCYLDSLDLRLRVISALHQSINDKFRANGISIAYPQRDVHLSTAKPLDLRVHSLWPEAREASAAHGGEAQENTPRPPVADGIKRDD
jgi:potassium efflux system protein